MLTRHNALDVVWAVPYISARRTGGAVAQLGEHKAGSLGVRGSSPLSSTIAPTNAGRSSSGRTTASGAVYGGSNPPLPTSFVSHGGFPRTLGMSARHAARVRFGQPPRWLILPVALSSNG